MAVALLDDDVHWVHSGVLPCALHARLAWSVGIGGVARRIDHPPRHYVQYIMPRVRPKASARLAQVGAIGAALRTIGHSRARQAFDAPQRKLSSAMTANVQIIGGGLAGCEAAWQLAERGHAVRLFEMRPQQPTAAHTSDRLAELVCSNSMGSTLPDRALGILKQEMLDMGSLIIRTAFNHAVARGQRLGRQPRRLCRRGDRARSRAIPTSPWCARK